MDFDAYFDRYGEPHEDDIDRWFRSRSGPPPTEPPPEEPAPYEGLTPEMLAALTPETTCAKELKLFSEAWAFCVERRRQLSEVLREYKARDKAIREELALRDAQDATREKQPNVLSSRLRSLARYHALRATRTKGTDARAELHHQYDELCREAADALDAMTEEDAE